VVPNPHHLMCVCIHIKHAYLSVVFLLLVSLFSLQDFTLLLAGLHSSLGRTSFLSSLLYVSREACLGWDRFFFFVMHGNNVYLGSGVEDCINYMGRVGGVGVVE
jgi:hypothetical protein